MTLSRILSGRPSRAETYGLGILITLVVGAGAGAIVATSGGGSDPLIAAAVEETTTTAETSGPTTTTAAPPPTTTQTTTVDQRITTLESRVVNLENPTTTTAPPRWGPGIYTVGSDIRAGGYKIYAAAAGGCSIQVPLEGSVSGPGGDPLYPNRSMLPWSYTAGGWGAGETFPLPAEANGYKVRFTAGCTSWGT